MSARLDGRDADQLRPVEFVRDYTTFAAGSWLVRMGNTVVLCTASVAEDVPRWMRGTGRGWVTAEYSMLPGSSPERVGREAARGRQSGRTQEIQRLIGRSLRAVTDLAALGEVQIALDCDVLQADGGTRTASICGAYLALHDACSRLVVAGRMATHPLRAGCAAVSVGVVDGTALLDLAYSEDSRAETDMNVVMTSHGQLHRGPGHGGGGAVQPPGAGRAAGAGLVGHRDPFGRAEPGAGHRAAGAVSEPEFVLATANADKAREIAEILGPRVILLPRPADVADVAETGATLLDNARIKATALVEATGRPAIADDTGLEVAALGDAPGVHTARFAGAAATAADNITKLLAVLEGEKGTAARRARFRTSAVARWPDGRETVAEGEVTGWIAEVPAGEGGFGYDPIFVPAEGDGRTFAELVAEDPARKHRLSHRGRAFRRLAERLGV